jgi:alkylresorcinol/alkylpyrone synthase
MSLPPVSLLSVATASPPYELRQDEVIARARAMFEDRMPQFLKLMPVFGNTGIRARQAVMPIEWYLRPRSWPDRTQAYVAGALELFAAAAGKALEEAGIAAREVDAIVTVSSTGIATPSQEARAIERLGLRPDAARVPVFGLGCAGGATGVALGARLARARPGDRILVVVVELCTLSFRLEDMSTADVVATALFGDGAAACVLTTAGEGLAQITGFAEHTWPGTLDIMGWRVDPNGLGVIFAQSIPPFVLKRLGPAMDGMLATQALGRQDVDRFVCHPGGTKVVEALEAALDLGQGSLDVEREVLAAHGNMSAPTVLFILDALRRRGLPGRSVMTALGPGFTASTVTLRAA